MEPTPKISIIVPAFNADAFLERCINSILAQAQKSFEIIIVDDGSTDRTAGICDGLIKADPRIKVIHKENGGVSSARNSGLDLARGEWITFVDADDSIAGQYLPGDFDNKNDMYVQNWSFMGSNSPAESLVPQIIDNAALPSFWQSHFHWDLFRSTLSKIIKRSILDLYHIRFDEGQKLGEDTLFFMDYIMYCKQVCVLNTGQYLYYRPEGDWYKKYNLSLDSILSYFRAFLERYDRLDVPLPLLADFEYSFFSLLLDESEKKKNAWRLSRSVLRMKELRLPVCNPPVSYQKRLHFLKLVSSIIRLYR